MLSDIQAEWEDWQHDLLLDTIRQQLTNPGSCAAPAKRRGRAEMEAPSNTTAAPATQAAAGAAAAQEPRRVSTAHQRIHTCVTFLFKPPTPLLHTKAFSRDRLLWESSIYKALRAVT